MLLVTGLPYLQMSREPQEVASPLTQHTSGNIRDQQADVNMLRVV